MNSCLDDVFCKILRMVSCKYNAHDKKIHDMHPERMFEKDSLKVEGSGVGRLLGCWLLSVSFSFLRLSVSSGALAVGVFCIRFWFCSLLCICVPV